MSNPTAEQWTEALKVSAEEAQAREEQEPTIETVYVVRDREHTGPLVAVLLGPPIENWMTLRRDWQREHAGEWGVAEGFADHLVHEHGCRYARYADILVHDGVTF